MKGLKALLTKDILLVLATAFLYNASTQLITPTFPLYVAQLGGEERIVGVLAGLYTFTAVFMRPLLGKVMNRRGRKFVLYVSMLASITGPLLYTLNWGFLFLALARIFHATSLAGFITASQTLLAEFSPEGKRGSVISLYSVANGIALASAPAVGFALVERTGFQPLFLLASAVALLAMPCISAIREPQGARRDSLAVATPTLQLLRNGWVVVPSAVLFAITMIQGATQAFLPLHGVSVGMKNVGIFFSVYSAASMVTAALIGFVSDKVGRKTLAVPALLLIVAGTLCLTLLPSFPMLIVAAVCMGGGFPATYNSLLALILDRASLADRPQAVGIYANAYDLGVSTGSMALGVIAHLSFNLLWIFAASSAGLGVLLTLFALPGETVKRRRELAG